MCRPSPDAAKRFSLLIPDYVVEAARHIHRLLRNVLRVPFADAQDLARLYPLQLSGRSLW
jgi:hypothetical protein